MLTKLTLAAAVVAAAAFLTPASAVPFTSQANTAAEAAADGGLVTQAHYRRHRVHRHRSLRRRCASRHGWRTRGFYRCVRRHR